MLITPMILTANSGETRLRYIQIACLACFFITIIAVPAMLSSKPSLKYYMLNSTNFSSQPTVDYHSSTQPYNLLILFLFPSTLEHLFAVAFPQRYARFLGGIGWHRWISYAISAPSMMALVVYSVGPGSEIAVSVLTAGLIVVCIGAGPIVEYAHGNKDTFLFRLSMLLGFVALFFAFIPVWYYYSRADIPSDIAPFVAAMMAIITTLYWSFGFVPIYLYLKKDVAPYYKREMVYCTLSLCSKIPLAWLYASMLYTRF